MEKNCSGCKGFHVAPFGSRCKHRFCSACHSRHLPPFGTLCKKTVSSPLSQLTMTARTDPVIDTFEDRNDPKYLQYLEDSFMKNSDKDMSEMELIRRQLEALETRQTTPPAPNLPLPDPDEGCDKPKLVDCQNTSFV